jgi:hypothetical protein
MRESVNRVLSSEKTLERLVTIAKGEKSSEAKSKPESVDDTQDGEDGSTEEETSEQSEGE